MCVPPVIVEDAAATASRPAGTDRTGMHIGKWRMGDMNSVLVIPANNSRSSAWRCCETAHLYLYLRRRCDYLFRTSDAEPMQMIGFVRLAHSGRKPVLCLCICCRVVGVVLECYMSVVASCPVCYSVVGTSVPTSFLVWKLRISPSRLIAQMSSEI